MSRRGGRTAAAACLGGFFALTAAAQTVNTPDSGLHLVSPGEKATTTAESVPLILVGADTARAPVLSIGSRPLVLGRLTLSGPGAAPNRRAVWVAEARLSLGPNVIRAAGKPICTVTRTEAGNGGAGERQFRIHPPVSEKKACLDCHKRAGDALSLPRTPSSCHSCHTEDDLPVIHRHVMDPFARCQTCHNPHGGDRPHLLKDAREKLCIRCHEAGHSKP